MTILHIDIVERVEPGPLVLRRVVRSGYPKAIAEWEVWNRGERQIVTSDESEASEHFDAYKANLIG
jgi:hypothetical protein